MEKNKLSKKIVNIAFFLAWTVILINISISFFIKSSLTPETLGNYIVISWTIHGICAIVIFIKSTYY
ncbi:hypothetical protein [Anaerotignum sp. MB30-C6]|uniref:hypothetical protein n=1 Tax=Anaerotignum sp. MB30-C6 TaxID=3070814 RepID=UPI0027DD9B1D|nr:hypothetical protein [Anaerotignum sp. MB30-C6]WMI80444.1 hypothetical protein RBQ60_11480 [Anaerotignum sp. MB30-C6]